MARNPHRDAEESGRSKADGRDGAPERRIRPWQRSLVVASLVVSLVGLVMMGVAWATGTAEPTPAAGQTDPLPASGFAPTGEDGGGAEQIEPEPTGLEAWSPAVFRLGFSFFVGFAIAFALRTFAKISIAAIGLMLLALFGLQYAGVIDVDWAAMEGHFDTAVRWIKEQSTGFRDFITGYVPSAASALGGMFVGFRKG